MIGEPVLIVIAQSPHSAPGEGVSNAVLATLEAAVNERVPNRFTPPRWALAEAEVHCAPFVLVEGEAQVRASHSGGLIHTTPMWSWRISYAVAGMRWVDARVPDTDELAPRPEITRLRIGDPVAVLPHQERWHTRTGVDMSAVADAVADAVTTAPPKVPAELRLGQAAARYHLANDQSHDARHSLLARASNEASWPSPPTPADQARRAGLGKVTWGRWLKSSWQDDPDDTDADPA